MTKQLAVAARDHGTGIPEQGFDRVANRGVLPLIAAQASDMKNDLSDILLRCAVSCPVEGLQHPARSCPLLPSQAGIRGNGSTMQRRQKAMDGLEAVEAFDAERHQSNQRPGVPCEPQNLQSLPIPDVASEMVAMLVAPPTVQIRMNGEIVRQNHWRRSQNDGAGILLGQPDYRRCGRVTQGIDKEIAAPSAGGSCPSTAAGRFQLVPVS